MTATPRWCIYAALFGAAVLFNYGLLRVRPRVKEWQALATERDLLEAKVAAMAGQSDLRGLARLEGDLDQARAALAADRAALEAAGARFAGPSQAGELAVQVSALAHEVGLVVEGEEALPEMRRAADRDLAQSLAQAPFERPLRRWTLRGGFAGLWSFLDRLRTLPWQAVVVRLSVERRGHLGRYEPPLQITMTLAL